MPPFTRGGTMIGTQEAQQPELTQAEIDQRVFDLYDEYCHGRITRREFFARSSVITVAGVSGLAMAEAMLPRYARAQTIASTDARIKAQYVTYPSPAGIAVHENRGMNPYIEDIARRFAVEGFLALAPDGLAPVGGYPDNDDEGRDMQTKLDQ